MYSIYKTILSIFLAYDLFFASSANDNNCPDLNAESDVHTREELLNILSKYIIKSCTGMNMALKKYTEAREEYEKITPERRKSIEDYKNNHKKYEDLYQEEIKQILNLSISDFKEICDSIERYNTNQSINRLQNFNPPVSDIYFIIMKCICSRFSMKILYLDIYSNISSSVQEKIDGCIAQLAGSTKCSNYDSVTKNLDEAYSTILLSDNNDKLRRVNRRKTIDKKQIKVDLEIYDRFLEAQDILRNFKYLEILRRCSVAINNFIIANTDSDNTDSD